MAQTVVKGSDDALGAARRSTATPVAGRPAGSTGSVGRGWLFVLPWGLDQYGGVSEVVSNLYRQASADREVEPTFMMLDWSAADVIEQTVVDGRTIAKARLHVPGAAARDLRAQIAFMLFFVPTVMRLWRYLRAHEISVVNVHYPTLEAIYFAYMRRMGFIRRLVISVHGSEIGRLGEHGAIERMAYRYIYSAADSVVACSSAFAGTLPSYMSKRAVAIHNGIDTGRLEAELASDDAHAGSPVSNSSSSTEADPIGPYVLCVATIERKKGLDVLVAAFAAIATTTARDLRLVIIGRPTDYADVLRATIADVQARQPDLRGRIEVRHGEPHATILRRMRGATLFVLPSRIEPFGIVLLEAGYLGIPIVASRVGGIPEIVESGRDGLLVAPDDVDALAAAMRQLLSDPVAARRLSHSLRQRVIASFSWRDAWSRYRALGTAP